MKKLGRVGAVLGAVLMMAGVQVCAAADAAAPQIRVAVVNVQSVLQQSPKVAELSKKLENEFKARQKKINDEQTAMQDALDKFKKESPTMSQKERDAQQKKLTADRADLVKQVVAYQQDLNKEQGKIMQGILNDLNGIVSSIAKDQSYSLVLDAQAVIFAADGQDITKEVAKKFNDKK